MFIFQIAGSAVRRPHDRLYSRGDAQPNFNLYYAAWGGGLPMRSAKGSGEAGGRGIAI